jgi:hypothetical protein
MEVEYNGVLNNVGDGIYPLSNIFIHFHHSPSIEPQYLYFIHHSKWIDKT